MLYKPDIHPNAAMNQWISAILMFDFELKHVPGEKHKGQDESSRQRVAEEGEEVGEGVEEAEIWVDEVPGCGVWVASSFTGSEAWVMGAGGAKSDGDDGFDGFLEVWNEDRRVKEKEKVKEIREFLETMKLPNGLTDKTK
ncbi:hypothetical protein AN958_09447 [Leucoagaricus sp. SymC.cos]|nr:hypothetical protein AN958_09447 [Leucoagaricus sp. SymC.cos]